MYLKKNKNCIYETVEDGIIVFNNLSEDTVVLNKTAAFLFDHCNFTTKDKLIDDFISILVNVRDYSLVKKECTECIDKMIDIGLIVETADDRE